MKRRDLIQTAALAAVGVGMTRRVSAESEEAPLEVIDTNISLFHWPFRRLPLDDTDSLVKKLGSLGVVSAFAGSYEAILQRDMGAVNRKLAETCGSYRELLPMGSVNPAAPGWEKDLDLCLGELEMPGVRLFPTAHGYGPDHKGVAEMASRSAVDGFLIQVVATLEDPRTQPESFRTPELDLEVLGRALTEIPGCRIQILNWRPRGAIPAELVEHSGVFFDTARADGTDGVSKLVKAVSADRVLHGSHAPFLIPEAALIRTVLESLLDDEVLRKVASGNANSLLQEGKA